jgi:hypothetical protein
MAKPKPIFALPPDERRRAVERFSGQRVQVDVSSFRDRDDAHNYVLAGRCLGVAIPNIGTAADMLILNDGKRWHKAISLATVRSVTLA